MRIALYISNHGYGHAMRMIALVREFITAGVECRVVTDRPAFLFHGLEDPLLTVREGTMDFGFLEKDWHTPDPDATSDRLIDLWSRRAELIDAELAHYTTWKPDLLVADIPPLAFAVAERLSVPSVAVSNFDWPFIYRAMLPDSPALREVLDGFARYQAGAALALRLPFSGPDSLTAFPRIEDAGILASPGRPDRRRIRREFRIPRGSRIVSVITRTGEEADIPRLCRIPGLTVLSPIPVDHPAHRTVPRDYDYGMLIASSDIVIAKAGYSTFAECAQSGTFMIYTDRTGYAEDPLLTAEMRRHGHGLFIPNEQLADTDWEKAIRDAGQPGKRMRARYRNRNRAIAARILAEAPVAEETRHAVIDVGTNMMMLLWAVVENGKVVPVFRAADVTTLGKGMRDGVLRREGIRRARASLDDFVRMTRNFTDDIHVIGTSCSRRASNIGDIGNWLKRRHGLDYRVISGELEAECSGLIAAREFPGPVLSFDIGGGSTEFVLSADGRQVRRLSLELGLRQLDNDFGDDLARKTDYIRATLRPLLDWKIGNAELIAIGGSGTNLAVLKHGMRHYNPEVVHGTVIDLADLEAFEGRFRSLSLSRIREMVPFEPERAGIILSGVVILREVLRLFGQNHATICERGLHFGYLHHLIDSGRIGGSEKD